MVLRNKLNYTHTNVRAKVQRHQLLLLIVFPTQMLSANDLFRIMAFVLTTRRAPVNSISCLFWWPKSYKKAFSTYHCLEFHIFFFFFLFMRVESTCKVNKKKTIRVRINFLIIYKETL